MNRTSLMESMFAASQTVHRHTDGSSGRKPNMAENIHSLLAWFVVYQQFGLWQAFPLAKDYFVTICRPLPHKQAST